jgi:hypothetical protein
VKENFLHLARLSHIFILPILAMFSQLRKHGQ